MRFFAKDGKAHYLGWRFEPKADITAFEIAMILRGLGGTTGGGALPLEVGLAEEGKGPHERLPPEAARHFVRAPEEDEWL